MVSLAAFTSPRLSLVLLIPGVSVDSFSWLPGLAEPLQPLLEVTSPLSSAPKQMHWLSTQLPAGSSSRAMGTSGFHPCRVGSQSTGKFTLLWCTLKCDVFSRALNRIFVPLLFVSKISYPHCQLQEKWASLLLALCHKPAFMTELQASGVYCHRQIKVSPLYKGRYLELSNCSSYGS